MAARKQNVNCHFYPKISNPVGGRRLVCKIRHGLGRHQNPSNFSLIKDLSTGIEIKEVGIMTR